MRRGNVSAYQFKMTGKKIKEIVNTINTGNLEILDKLQMTTNISSRKYIEDETNDIRIVNVISFGLPVQFEVCFYI